jgi:hypothetical protein
MAAQPAIYMVSSAARLAVRAAAATSLGLNQGIRLADCQAREVVDDIFAHALKKQTGVSLKYMLDFGSCPIERQLVLSSQFLHKELPVRLAHRVAELENLPYGLSSKSSILKVGGTVNGQLHLVSCRCWQHAQLHQFVSVSRRRITAAAQIVCRYQSCLLMACL